MQVNKVQEQKQMVVNTPWLVDGTGIVDTYTPSPRCFERRLLFSSKHGQDTGERVTSGILEMATPVRLLVKPRLDWNRSATDTKDRTTVLAKCFTRGVPSN